MKKNLTITFLIILLGYSFSGQYRGNLNLTCQDYSWGDVESLASPYLNETLLTALVVQGQSSNYKTSEAAIQAMDDSLPDAIKRILQSLISADC